MSTYDNVVADMRERGRRIEQLEADCAQLREECRQMRDDITALVVRAEKAEAERDRFKHACHAVNAEVIQTLGKALGYPWFKDDLKNFPGSTEADGVAVGEHVAETIAMEAARKIAELEAERDAAQKDAATLREALVQIDQQVLASEFGEMRQLSSEGMGKFELLLENTAAGAAAYEARIRADERRKVYTEERDRLNRLLDDLEESARGFPGDQRHYGYRDSVRTQRDYFCDRLAALESEGA